MGNKYLIFEVGLTYICRSIIRKETNRLTPLKNHGLKTKVTIVIISFHLECKIMRTKSYMYTPNSLSKKHLSLHDIHVNKIIFKSKVTFKVCCWPIYVTSLWTLSVQSDR